MLQGSRAPPLSQASKLRLRLPAYQHALFAALATVTFLAFLQHSALTSDQNSMLCPPLLPQ